MLEPENNPNPSFLVDPPGWLCRLLSRRVLGRVADPTVIQARREKAEARRRRRGEPHVVDYFHQLDDPYSHLAAQVLATFAARYDVVLRLHLIPDPNKVEDRQETPGAPRPDRRKTWETH